MSVCVVFASCSSVGCSIIAMADACGTHLLVIIDPVLLKDFIESYGPISIASIKPVSSELLQLSVGHLFSLF